MRTEKYLKNKRLWHILGLFAVDGLFFTLTNPDSVPSAMLMVGFVLLVVTIYALTKLLLSVPRFYGLDVHRKVPGLTGLITVLLAVVLALDSTGQLSSRDVLVIVPLAAISYVYLRSLKSRKVS